MEADGSSSGSPPPWFELPIDVNENILGRLGPMMMLNRAEKVCTTWRSMCSEPSLWRVLHMKYPYQLLDTDEKRDQARTLCRRAVDRSQGELTDININHFATDDLLGYISQRSTRLKILTLENCGFVTGNGLATSVKNFPCLEELHLFNMTWISAKDIEAIGIACPMLKAFTFYRRELCLGAITVYNRNVYNDNEWVAKLDNNNALSIAENMPNLVRLCLVRNLLMNEGLLAILDGCRNLEWLDLWRCSQVDMQGDLGRRCSEQIKVLRGPYQWDDNQFYDPEDPDDYYDDDYGLAV